MKNLNEVVLMGNLTADPELKYTTSGTAVANLRVATNKVYTDKAGVKQEKTQFHKVLVWTKLAETCAQFLKKGDPVYLKGELEYRSYEKDGVKQYITEVVAQDIIFLPTGRDRTTATPPAGAQAAPAPVPEDDIPF